MRIILIIDDDISFLETIEAQLSGNRFRVFTAMTGEEGLSTAMSLNPDLIICDVNMPGMDGLEVLKKLRKDKITDSIPVIMLTAVNKKEAVYSAMRYNIIDYMIKPYSIEALIKKINSAIHYNNIKKNETISSKDKSILVSRDQDSVIVSFNVKLNSKQIFKEVKEILNEFFFKSISNKKCVIDLRSLSEFDIEDAKILNTIIKLFGQKKLFIVAGRHYGEIVSNLDFDEIDFGEKTNFFISFGDMDISLSNTE